VNRRPGISAHRGGSESAPGGTYAAYRSALEAGAEYAEIDVRRTSDGVLVACHGPRAGWGRAVASLSYVRLCALAGFEVPRMAVVLQLLAGRAIGHLDLKEAGCAAEAVGLAAEMLGPAGFMVTTRDGDLAASVKRCVPAGVGVTVGGDFAETARFALRRACGRRPARLGPVLAAQGDWAVLHHRLARAALLDDCRRRGIKTMVWTVNGDRALTRLLAGLNVDVVVTDRPARARALRDQHGPAAAGHGSAGGGRWPVLARRANAVCGATRSSGCGAWWPSTRVCGTYRSCR
jgi:glycerophosphoryl diester phosphodiesterase